MPHAMLYTGVNAYYEVSGSGDPAVLIQGTGMPCDIWRPYQVPALSQRHTVIIYDLRGIGRSQHPDEVMTIPQLGNDVVALLDHLQLPAAHIIGHSMGGRIGLAIALEHPRRVKSLVLAGSGSGPVVMSGERCVPIPGLEYYEGLIHLGFEGYVREEVFDTHTYFTDEFRRNHPERVREFWDLAWPHHAGVRTYLRHLQARHTFEATHRLAWLQPPALVVCGEGDTAGNDHVPQAVAMARRIPGAKLVWLQNQAHGHFWQGPEETNDLLLRWLAEHA